MKKTFCGQNMLYLAFLKYIFLKWRPTNYNPVLINLNAAFYNDDDFVNELDERNNDAQKNNIMASKLKIPFVRI